MRDVLVEHGQNLVYIDGTFSAVEAGMQLLVVLVQVGTQPRHLPEPDSRCSVFVCQVNRVGVPVAYLISSKKDYFTYCRFFLSLREVTANRWKPRAAIVDFEPALVK